MLPIPLKCRQTDALLKIPIAVNLVKQIHLKQVERDYYEILGVSKKASSVEIKAAFYRKSKELHPDNSQCVDSTVQFVELKKAYDILRRPADRQAYDNRGRRDYNNIYGDSTYSGSYSHRPQYDFSDDWRRFWRETDRSNFSDSETKKRSEQQWRIIWQWTAVGTFLVILYNIGYLMQIYWRDYQLSKLLDEDEIARSFLRQSEFKGKEFDDVEKVSLAKMLKADVDEAWRRRQEEMRGRNRDEIREEYRWLKAVQDSEHMRKIKARRAELRRQETEARWGRSKPGADESTSE